MSDSEKALDASVEHLRHIVEGLDEGTFTAQAYPTEWTVAAVMSHIGSGAVIMRHSLDAAASGSAVADGVIQSVWDEWNAKPPAAQVADALVADRSALDRLGELTDEERATARFSIGPMSLDLVGYLGMRLNEHALHTWDVEVTVDPAATVPSDAAALIVDTLPLIAGFSGRSDGVERTVKIRTTDPAHEFVLTIGTERVTLEPASASEAIEATAAAELTLPAEALVRLVYGRLDAAHTPAGVDEAVVATLRPTFPGF